MFLFFYIFNFNHFTIICGDHFVWIQTKQSKCSGFLLPSLKKFLSVVIFNFNMRINYEFDVIFNVLSQTLFPVVLFYGNWLKNILNSLGIFCSVLVKHSMTGCSIWTNCFQTILKCIPHSKQRKQIKFNICLGNEMFKLFRHSRNQHQLLN